MDALKRYWFWISAGVALLAIIVVYVLLGLENRQKAEIEERKAKNLAEEIENLAQGANLPNKGMIRSADEYRKKLDEQLELIRKTWPEAVKYPDAPADLLQFASWRDKRKEEILAKAKEGGLTLPENFAKDKLYEGRSVPAAEREEWRNKIFLTGELVNTLTLKPKKISVRRFKGGDAAEETYEVEVGAVALEKMNFLHSARMAQILREGRTKAYAASAGGRTSYGGTAIATTPSKFYKLEGVDLTFTAVLSAVPELLKALESNPVYFAELMRLDLERAVDPYASDGNLKDEAPGKFFKEWKPADGWESNSWYREGLVRVSVLLGFYEFDAKAAGLTEDK